MTFLVGTLLQPDCRLGCSRKLEDRWGRTKHFVSEFLYLLSANWFVHNSMLGRTECWEQETSKRHKWLKVNEQNYWQLEFIVRSTREILWTQERKINVILRWWEVRTGTEVLGVHVHRSLKVENKVKVVNYKCGWWGNRWENMMHKFCVIFIYLIWKSTFHFNCREDIGFFWRDACNHRNYAGAYRVKSWRHSTLTWPIFPLRSIWGGDLTKVV